MTLRLHDFECASCHVVHEAIVDGEETPKCPVCNWEMTKLPPIVRCNMGAAGAYGYFDETLGTYVSTNRQRRELCRQQGVTPKGETPKPNGEAWV